jgi:hypothetical protein
MPSIGRRTVVSPPNAEPEEVGPEEPATVSSALPLVALVCGLLTFLYSLALIALSIWVGFVQAQVWGTYRIGFPTWPILVPLFALAYAVGVSAAVVWRRARQGSVPIEHRVLSIIGFVLAILALASMGMLALVHRPPTAMELAIDSVSGAAIRAHSVAMAEGRSHYLHLQQSADGSVTEWVVLSPREDYERVSWGDERGQEAYLMPYFVRIVVAQKVHTHVPGGQPLADAVKFMPDGSVGASTDVVFEITHTRRAENVLVLFDCCTGRPRVAGKDD